MNIQADPVGYKALSRHFANSNRADAEIFDELRQQGRFIRLFTYAVMTLAVIAVFVILHQARAIAMPIVAAIVVGLILGPIGDKAARYRIPPPLTAALLVMGFMAVFFGLVVSVSPSIHDFSQAIPRIAKSLDRITANMEGMFSIVDAFKSKAAGQAALVTETKTSTVDMATRVASIVTPAVSQIVVFLFTLLLFVAGRQEIRKSLAMSFGDREHRLSALRSFTKAENSLTEYVLAVSTINIGLGLLVAGSFWLLGIPGGLIWGLLAFAVNFLPVVGPLLLKVGLILFGLASDQPLLPAMLPFGLYLGVSLIEANLITPRVIGAKMTLSPLTVFLAVVFWTWMWGFVGALLAMPLLAIVRVVNNEFAED